VTLVIATRRGTWARSRAVGLPSIGVVSLLLGLAAVVFALMTLDWVEPRLRALLTVRAKKETAPS
jgi:tetrahydromethanopterin S-methyltransferase subunit C